MLAHTGFTCVLNVPAGAASASTVDDSESAGWYL